MRCKTWGKARLIQKTQLTSNYSIKTVIKTNFTLGAFGFCSMTHFRVIDIMCAVSGIGVNTIQTVQLDSIRGQNTAQRVIIS